MSGPILARAGACVEAIRAPSVILDRSGRVVAARASTCALAERLAAEASELAWLMDEVLGGSASVLVVMPRGSSTTPISLALAPFADEHVLATAAGTPLADAELLRARLHDGLCQHVSGLAFVAGAAQLSCEAGDLRDVPELVAKVEGLVEVVSSDARAVLATLDELREASPARSIARLLDEALPEPTSARAWVVTAGAVGPSWSDATLGAVRDVVAEVLRDPPAPLWIRLCDGGETLRIAARCGASPWAHREVDAARPRPP